VLSLPIASTRCAGLPSGKPVGRWIHTFSRYPVLSSWRCARVSSAKTKMNPNGLSTGVVRVMGHSDSRQWRSAMAAATTASPELRLTTARTVVRVSTATNVMISIINQQSEVLFPPELPSSQLSSSSPPRARSCRVCDTRVPLFSELPITAANLHLNSKAYEASLSFESPPRVERCIHQNRALTF